jgi:hypothetical protein
MDSIRFPFVKGIESNVRARAIGEQWPRTGTDARETPKSPQS